VLVPTISGLKETDPQAIPRIYRESYRLIFFLAVPTFSLLVVVSPIVSHIWLGRYEPIFIQFVALLAFGWLVNVLSNPAYVVDLGTGSLRWVSVGCAVTAVLNLAFGYSAGRHVGGAAIVAASAMSLALGYAIVLVAYLVENRIAFRTLLPGNSVGTVCASISGLIGVLLYFWAKNLRVTISFGNACLILFVLSTMILLSMWLHPMRKQLIAWIWARLPEPATISGS
jgi:O-antigen/teichoic acid export membrane protein